MSSRDNERRSCTSGEKVAQKAQLCRFLKRFLLKRPTDTLANES